MRSAVPPCVRVLQTLVWLLVFAQVPRAHAESTTGDLRVDAPAACGSATELATRLERLLGRPLTALPQAELRIAPQGEGYRLELRQGAELRVVEDGVCRSLFEAAVLMVAVELGLSPAGESPERAEPTPAPLQVAHTLSTPARRSAAQLDAPGPFVMGPAERDDTRGRRVPLARSPFLGVGAGLAFGPVPRTTALLEVLLGLHLGRVRLALSGHYLTPRESGGTEAVRVRGLGGSLMLGVRPWSWLELGAGIEGHVLRGRAVQAAVGSDTARAGGPRLSLWATPWAGRAQLDVGLHAGFFPRRPHFVTPAGASLYRAPSLAFGVGLRGFWNFL